MRDPAAFIDQRIAEIADQADCDIGCSQCCHRMLVTISGSEAARFAAHLGEMPPRQREETVKRLKAQAEAEGDIAERYNTPCGFLVDDLCSIYETRPLVCRGYLSSDRKYCAEMKEPIDQLIIKSSTIVLLAFPAFTHKVAPAGQGFLATTILNQMPVK